MNSSYRIDIINKSLKQLPNKLRYVKYAEFAPTLSRFFSKKDGIHLTPEGKVIYAHKVATMLTGTSIEFTSNT